MNKYGGMIKRQSDCLDNYEPIQNPWRTDCAANCFKFLNYSDNDTSLYLANRTPKGITMDKLLEIYKKAYPDPEAKWIMIKSSSTTVTSTDIDMIKTYLPESYATIILVVSKMSIHYVILLHYDGVLKILDPQKMCPSGDYITYVDNKKIQEVFLFNSLETNDNKVTVDIINEVLTDKFIYPFPNLSWTNPDLETRNSIAKLEKTLKRRRNPIEHLEEKLESRRKRRLSPY